MGDLFDWIGDVFEAVWDVIEGVVDAVWDFISGIIEEITGVVTDIMNWLQETLGPILTVLEIVLFFTGAPIIAVTLTAIDAFATRVWSITEGVEKYLITELAELYKTVAWVEAGLYEWTGKAIAAVYKDIGVLHDQVILAVEKHSEELADRIREETEDIMLVMDSQVDRIDHEIHTVAYKVEDVGHFGDMLTRTLEV